MNWTYTIVHGSIVSMTKVQSLPAVEGSQLTGLYVPLITPFTEHGELASSALEALAHHVLEAGATGLVALGTTAEAATLSDRERCLVLDICARVCGERAVPLIAGAGSNDTRRTAEAVRELARWPQISAALVATPSYTRPGEEGVFAHFGAIVQDSPVPLVVYNVPARTGQALSWPTMRRLAKLPGITGVKQAVGCIDADTVSMLASPSPGFSVLAGDGCYASALLALGACGAILAEANVCPGPFAELVSGWRAGDVALARTVGHRLTALCTTLFAEPNPTVIKAVLHRLGHIPSPAVRLPLLPASLESAEAALCAASELADAA